MVSIGNFNRPLHMKDNEPQKQSTSDYGPQSFLRQASFSPFSNLRVASVLVGKCHGRLCAVDKVSGSSSAFIVICRDRHYFVGSFIFLSRRGNIYTGAHFEQGEALRDGSRKVVAARKITIGYWLGQHMSATNLTTSLHNGGPLRESKHL